MKKARLILAFVALLAIVGGALAFKVGKFSKGPRAYSWTNITSITVGAFVYTGTGLLCVTPQVALFINTIVDGSGISTYTYSTTIPNQVLTLTHIPGGQTITRPFIGCLYLPNTLVTDDN